MLLVEKKETFTAAIKQNEWIIYKTAAIYTNTSEDRNDLIQEIIYQLWKSFDSFKQNAALGTWIYRVAMNVAIYHLSKNKRRVSTIPLDAEQLSIPAEDAIDIEEKWQILKQHLDNLNLLDKGIVMLYMENKSYEEIAGIIGISVSNVGVKLARIKEKLKNQILKQQPWN